jgi:hypothetical protein
MKLSELHTPLNEKVLTAADRKQVSKKDEGVPSKHGKPGAYPMPDKAHARAAKGFAAMHHSPNKAAIDAKADKILGK